MGTALSAAMGDRLAPPVRCGGAMVQRQPAPKAGPHSRWQRSGGGTSRLRLPTDNAPVLPLVQAAVAHLTVTSYFSIEHPEPIRLVPQTMTEKASLPAKPFLGV